MSAKPNVGSLAGKMSNIHSHVGHREWLRAMKPGAGRPRSSRGGHADKLHHPLGAKNRGSSERARWFGHGVPRGAHNGVPRRTQSKKQEGRDDTPGRDTYSSAKNIAKGCGAGWMSPQLLSRSAQSCQCAEQGGLGQLPVRPPMVRPAPPGGGRFRFGHRRRHGGA